MKNPTKDHSIGDEDMGYAETLDWSLPTTQEHPKNKITDSNSITSSWWTKDPSHGEA